VPFFLIFRAAVTFSFCGELPYQYFMSSGMILLTVKNSKQTIPVLDVTNDKLFNTLCLIFFLNKLTLFTPVLVWRDAQGHLIT